MLPQAVRAVVPPLASVLIALLKNTTVAAVFGLARGDRYRMRCFTNDNADDRLGIFLTFASATWSSSRSSRSCASRLERDGKVAR